MPRQRGWRGIRRRLCPTTPFVKASAVHVRCGRSVYCRRPVLHPAQGHTNDVKPALPAELGASSSAGRLGYHGNVMALKPSRAGPEACVSQSALSWRWSDVRWRAQARSRPSWPATVEPSTSMNFNGSRTSARSTSSRRPSSESLHSDRQCQDHPRSCYGASPWTATAASARSPTSSPQAGRLLPPEDFLKKQKIKAPPRWTFAEAG